jgi:hypothetical protein
MKTINLTKEHYTLANGNLGSIHMSGNFFCDVEKETEKAVYIQYFGKLHWLPKSAFVGKELGGIVLFSIKPFFAKQIMNKFQ